MGIRGASTRSCPFPAVNVKDTGVLSGLVAPLVFRDTAASCCLWAETSSHNRCTLYGRPIVLSLARQSVKVAVNERAPGCSWLCSGLYAAMTCFRLVLSARGASLAPQVSSRSSMSDCASSNRQRTPPHLSLAASSRVLLDTVVSGSTTVSWAIYCSPCPVELVVGVDVSMASIVYDQEMVGPCVL